MQKRTPTLLAALAATALFSTSALAGHRDRYEDEDDQGRAFDYAQVLSAQPLYQEFRIREPREECVDERVVYREEYAGRERASSADRTLGAVVGGVIGGAVGHQFGRGSGRQIATAIGAVVGADIGRNAVNNSYGGERTVRERVAYEPHCRTVHETRYERRIEGYDVTYRYHGQVYNTRMPYDPGARLPVRVDVSPVRY